MDVTFNQTGGATPAPNPYAQGEILSALCRLRRSRRDLLVVERCPKADSASHLAHLVTLDLATLAPAVAHGLRARYPRSIDDAHAKLIGHEPRNSCIASPTRRVTFHVLQGLANLLAQLGADRLHEPPRALVAALNRAPPAARDALELAVDRLLLGAPAASNDPPAAVAGPGADVVRLPPRGNHGRISVGTSGTPAPGKPARGAPGFVTLDVTVPWVSAKPVELKLTPEQAEHYAVALRKMAAQARRERDAPK